MDLGLAGKVVVLTGAAGGIGRHTAQRFAEEGATVVAVDRDAAALDTLVAELPGGGHLALAATLTGQDSAEAVVARVLRSRGRIDVVAHLAGVLETIPVPEVDEEQWDRHMNVNVRATFFLTRAAAEWMRAENVAGRILIMSSGSWLSGGMPTRLPYATSKGAVTTMARSLAKEYGPAGITVNCVAPGLIDTGMMRLGLTAERRAEMEAATPLGRFGLPEEIADTTVYLCSARASFVSGATVNVSGGNTLY
ncbi:SDR family NAD(P)-dependent oxidoreductase [Herbiconiux sp. KACC 21604]|uniref:SDR family NAD(P)-dependent oxidoreductase n=1 Tax=unclassified Herbiconiux TaxID=2618217 RepID=UPI00149267F4|nr:SDR family NAD(P)-dependent oxidoreductase [Herbiconiux sp. SALV-R1]QJU52713.1 SDR family oxidoreductase [Herbiconiux sp. SALV-R1]WPO87613.1 SDR family NAD(P)-dependent oxidoreductase [Herbiconiux sp. KACC 21604]